MIVLGIETSCDESGVAIYSTEIGLLGDLLHSQIEVHAEYGGVVPELASRDHIRYLLPLIDQLLNQCELSKSDIDAIAYTQGPGLVGALLVGAAVAKSLAYGLQIPAIGVHHMEGHLLAPMLEETPPEYPFVALLVSGGHTQLIDVAAEGSYHILGESVDDAAGEAFDKTAKLLGLGYPGGPVIAEYAIRGDPKRYRFPRPMTDRPGLDFSFSGLKTFTMTTWKKSEQSEVDRCDIARAFEEAVVDTMAIKCRRAMQQSGYSRLVLAGGVSANQRLRERLHQEGEKEGFELYYPRTEFCTDNGAMIAYCGALKLVENDMQTGASDLSFTARPRWPLGIVDQ